MVKLRVNSNSETRRKEAVVDHVCYISTLFLQDTFSDIFISLKSIKTQGLSKILNYQ